MTVAARITTVWIVATLTACGSATSPSVVANDGASAIPAADSRPAATTKPPGRAASPTPPASDVAWDDRGDYEPWQPPLPPGQDGWPSEPPSRWPGLRAHLMLPPTVALGETVDYVVVLRNVSDERVDLRPCGGYRQEVRASGPGMGPEPVPGGKSTFRLNCDADPLLLPSESRRYAMRLVVPEAITGEEALFTWGFVDNMPDYDAQYWVPLS